MARRRSNRLSDVAVLILLVVGLVVVLQTVLSITATILWPIVLVGVGVAVGLWWAGRR